MEFNFFVWWNVHVYNSKMWLRWCNIYFYVFNLRSRLPIRFIRFTINVFYIMVKTPHLKFSVLVCVIILVSYPGISDCFPGFRNVSCKQIVVLFIVLARWFLNSLKESVEELMHELLFVVLFCVTLVWHWAWQAAAAWALVDIDVVLNDWISWLSQLCRWARTGNGLFRRSECDWQRSEFFLELLCPNA